MDKQPPESRPNARPPVLSYGRPRERAYAKVPWISAVGSLLVVWLWLTILRVLPNPISPRNREHAMLAWCFLSGFLVVVGAFVQDAICGPSWKDSKPALAMIGIAFVLVIAAMATLMFMIAWAHQR